MTISVPVRSDNRADRLLVLLHLLTADGEAIDRRSLERWVRQLHRRGSLSDFGTDHQWSETLYVVLNVLSHLGYVTATDGGYVITLEGDRHYHELMSQIQREA